MPAPAPTELLAEDVRRLEESNQRLAEAVQDLDEFEVELQRGGRVLVPGVERRQENAEVHAFDRRHCPSVLRTPVRSLRSRQRGPRGRNLGALDA